MNRVFASGLGDWGSIPGRVIPKTQKMVLDTASLSIQHYKVWINTIFIYRLNSVNCSQNGPLKFFFLSLFLQSSNLMLQFSTRKVFLI